jgi:hypothetical protein
MNDARLEKRMAELENELASLRKKVEELSDSSPWWERIVGTFHGDPVYQRAMKLGERFRRSQRPNGTPPSGR